MRSTLLAEQISDYLEDEIRPCVQGDGGDLTFLGIDDSVIHIAALNECSRCPLTQNCYKHWLKEKINSRFNSSYDIRLSIRKPYFWDK